MRVVTNEELIERNKGRAQLFTVFSIMLLIGSFFLYPSLDADENTLFLMQCFILPAMLGLVLFSVRLTNRWARLPYPWSSIRAGLKGIENDTALYSFVFPVDYLLVHQNGVFVLETRFQDRPQKVVNDRWEARAGVFGYMRQEQIGNPTRDAQKNAEQMTLFLRDLLKDESITVHPLIVFTHPGAQVEVDGENSVPIVYASSERTPSLKSYIRDARRLGYSSLTQAQLDLLDDLLLYEDATPAGQVALPDLPEVEDIEEDDEPEEDPTPTKPQKSQPKAEKSDSKAKTSAARTAATADSRIRKKKKAARR